MTTPTTQIGLLLFPNLTQLDLTGPAEVFGRLPNTQVHLLWKDLEPVASDRGLRILPTTRFEDCPTLDIICVPGGPGQVGLMDDAQTLAFLQRVSATSRWITSVCTGSLVLGAAGLLKGYRATSHWSSIEQLALLGAIPVNERVVHDRNRITGAGVTSGIDFALQVVEQLAGADMARSIQLQMEYDPQPPFAAGSPSSASKDLLASTRMLIAPFIERRRQATLKAARHLGL